MTIELQGFALHRPGRSADPQRGFADFSPECPSRPAVPGLLNNSAPVSRRRPRPAGERRRVSGPGLRSGHRAAPARPEVAGCARLPPWSAPTHSRFPFADALLPHRVITHSTAATGGAVPATEVPLIGDGRLRRAGAGGRPCSSSGVAVVERYTCSFRPGGRASCCSGANAQHPLRPCRLPAAGMPVTPGRPPASRADPRASYVGRRQPGRPPGSRVEHLIGRGRRSIAAIRRPAGHGGRGGPGWAGLTASRLEGGRLDPDPWVFGDFHPPPLRRATRCGACLDQRPALDAGPSWPATSWRAGRALHALRRAGRRGPRTDVGRGRVSTTSPLAQPHPTAADHDPPAARPGRRRGPAQRLPGTRSRATTGRGPIRPLPTKPWWYGPFPAEPVKNLQPDRPARRPLSAIDRREPSRSRQVGVIGDWFGAGVEDGRSPQQCSAERNQHVGPGDRRSWSARASRAGRPRAWDRDRVHLVTGGPGADVGPDCAGRLAVGRSTPPQLGHRLLDGQRRAPAGSVGRGRNRRVGGRPGGPALGRGGRGSSLALGGRGPGSWLGPQIARGWRVAVAGPKPDPDRPGPSPRYSPTRIQRPTTRRRQGAAAATRRAANPAAALRRPGTTRP